MSGGVTEGLLVSSGGAGQAAEGEQDDEGEVDGEGIDVEQGAAEGDGQDAEDDEEEEEGQVAA